MWSFCKAVLCQTNIRPILFYIFLKGFDDRPTEHTQTVYDEFINRPSARCILHPHTRLIVLGDIALVKLINCAYRLLNLIQ